MKYIFVNGYGWTGSSAISEALRQHTDAGYVPNEFDDFRVPNGVLDLYCRQRAKLGLSSIAYTKSHLAEFESLTGMPSERPKGWRVFAKSLARVVRPPISHKYNFGYRKFFLRQAWCALYEKYLFNKYKLKIANSETETQLNAAINEWLLGLTSEYSSTESAVLIDQGLLIETLEEFIDLPIEAFVIFVIRAPEKQLADITSNEVEFLKKLSWPMRFIIGIDNSDTKTLLDIFCRTTIKRLNKLNEMVEKDARHRILLLDYDQFLFDYQGQIERIANYCGLKVLSTPRFNIDSFDVNKSRLRNELLSSKVLPSKEVLSELQFAYDTLREKID